VNSGTRLDRWLWAARFYKKRRLATEAVAGGKVQVNGHRAKPGRSVNQGDEICVNHGGIPITVIIQGLSVQRGSASVAQQLFSETEQSVELRQVQIDQQRLIRQAAPRSNKRPDKKGRRDIARFRGR